MPSTTHTFSGGIRQARRVDSSRPASWPAPPSTRSDCAHTSTSGGSSSGQACSGVIRPPPVPMVRNASSTPGVLPSRSAEASSRTSTTSNRSASARSSAALPSTGGISPCPAMAARPPERRTAAAAPASSPMCVGQRLLMYPPPSTCSTSTSCNREIGWCQRASMPGLCTTSCAQAATSHGSAEGASVQMRHSVSVNRTFGCRSPSSTCAGPGEWVSSHTRASGAVSARCLSQPAAMSSSP